MRSKTSALAIAAVFLGLTGLAGCDPGNSVTQFGGRTLTPQSAAWGIAHYHHDGFFIDDNYDVTWIVVSAEPDVCAHFTRYMGCDPSTKRDPDGVQVSLDFNSFADSNNSIEDVTGGIHLLFREVKDGEALFEDQATRGHLSGRGRAGDRLFGSYDVTTAAGEHVEGSWSADPCESMSQLLAEEFAEREHCRAR